MDAPISHTSATPGRPAPYTRSTTGARDVLGDQREIAPGGHQFEVRDDATDVAESPADGEGVACCREFTLTRRRAGVHGHHHLLLRGRLGGEDPPVLIAEHAATDRIAGEDRRRHAVRW